MTLQKTLFEQGDSQDSFEGEETLGAEFRDLSNPAEAVSNEIYPDASVNIVPESASVFQLKRKHDKKPPLIRLDPDFQRHTVWTPKQKSELIESILMGIPLPLIYVKEDEKGVYIVVDGRQRLSTMFEFLNHEFALQQLSVLRDLNGSYFSEQSETGRRHEKYLSQAQQSKIEDCPLTLHVIKPPTQDRVTFDLFDRVNRGGTRLNNQEMRNAIYQGPATSLLNTLVSFDSFKIATEHSIKPDRMKDRYLVLRLIAFYLWRKNQLHSVKEKGQPLVEYKSDLEDFLGKTMLYLNDEASTAFRSTFPIIFDKAMQACVEVLGEGCFRLPKNGDGPRRPLSMALFETVGYLMIEMLDTLPAKEPGILHAYKELMQNDEFISSTTYIVDSNKSVNKRFEIIENMTRTLRYA